MAMHTELSRAHMQLRMLVMPALVAVVVSCAQAGWQADYASCMQRALTPVKADVDAVLATHAESEAVKEYRQRLGLLDKAAMTLIERIRKVQSAALAKMLADTPEMTPSGPRKGDTLPASASARTIYAEFCDSLAKPLPVPDIPEKGRELVQKCYATSFATAEQYVTGLGATAIALESKAEQEVLELCAVLPMLRTPDRSWSQTEIDGLPKWMRQPRTLKMLESFAVGIPRPLTAMAFAECASSKPWTSVQRRNYVAEVCHQRADAKQYDDAKHWGWALVQLAEKAGQSEQATEARLQMVRLHEESGMPWAAAMEAKSLMDACPGSPVWGKAAALHLKGLYAAGRFDDVNRYAQEYIADDRARIYLPQIIYLSWAANRRLGREDPAAELQKMFLERFPDHDLGAEMHFASAMTALTAGDYREAARRLEIIQYRHPQSSVAAKAAEIQARLDASGQTTKGQQGK